MVINASVQYNDDGFLPDIILLTLCYYNRGTRLNAMKRFCLCSLCSLLNVLTFFSPCLVDAQKVEMRSDFSLKNAILDDFQTGVCIIQIT